MSASNDLFTQETILHVQPWVPGKLFSFTCTRPTGYRFTAGQFARLGINNFLRLPGEPDIIWRAYSMVSGPYDEHLEFFSIVVPQGAFTSHLSQLHSGQTLYIDKTNFGFLTTARFETGKHLWLLASGTGLAPFLSMLYDPQTWEQFEHIILVHSARTNAELVYQERIQGLPCNPFMNELVPNLAQRFTYVPVVTREQSEGSLAQRITAILQNGTLEGKANIPFSKENSRFMICGNPSMVQDIRQQLKSMGYTPARKNTPGEIAVENYW